MVDAFIAHFFSDNCIYTKQKQKPAFRDLIDEIVTFKGVTECKQAADIVSVNKQLIS